MHNCITTIDGAIKELENLKKILTKKKVSHVNTIEEKNLIKARKDFNMTKHFPRLEGFVDKVFEKKR